MFTTMYDRLVGCSTEEMADCGTLVGRPEEEAELIKQSILLVLLQLCEVDDPNESGVGCKRLMVPRENTLQSLSALDRHLNSSIDLGYVEDVCEKVLKNYYGDRVELSRPQQDKKFKKNRVNKNVMNQIESYSSLFSWNLQSHTSQRDMITQIIKKYGHYNLNIFKTVITFKRYAYMFCLLIEVNFLICFQVRFEHYYCL